METISSPQTFFFKRIFPVAWLALVAVGMVVGVFAMTATNHAGQAPVFLLAPGVMLVIGIVVFRKLVWDLADEVKDGGSFLLVRRQGVEERVPLSGIINVSMSQFTNPRRLSLRLHAPGRFGNEIVFIPKAPAIQFNPFARNPIAEDLIQRVDRARREPSQ